MTNMTWPDSVDEILGGDRTIMLAYATPASGVVLAPVTNFAIRDREAGTISAVNSSVGVPKKLERIRRNPLVALAFHTREHGFSERPEYVLVQGRASLSEPDPRYMDSIPESFERSVGGEPSGGGAWQWWLRAWHLRVGIEIAVERVIVWPDLECGGIPSVYGVALETRPPEAQRQPAKGAGPRINHARAAARATRMPHLLFGWVGSDGFPVVVPVAIVGTESSGIVLSCRHGLLPPGGRRAGLTAHWFGQHNIGLGQRVHTGWLEGEGGDRAIYAPHTQSWVHIPRSKLAYKVIAGAATHRGMAEARRLGLAGPRDPAR